MATETDELIFTDEDDTRESKDKWKILIVDDDQIMHGPTIRTMYNEVYLNKPINFLSAYSAKEALEILSKNKDIAVILLDVVMEEAHSGLNVIDHIRHKLNNNYTQIILRTGQPGYAPEEDTIAKYKISNYLGKSEISALKLKSAIILAIRAFEYSINLEKEILKQKDEKEVLIRTILNKFANPTTEIKSACYKIDLKNPEKSHEYLEKVKVASKKQTDLIKTIHLEQISRAREFDFQLQPYPITDLVLAIESLFAETFVSKGIDFTSQFDPKLQILVDPFTFETIAMTFLVSNIIKLVSDGEKLSLVIDLVEKNRIEILISWNSGEKVKEIVEVINKSGVDPAVFEIKNKQNPVFEMSLVKSYIEAYGGTIKLHLPKVADACNQFQIILESVTDST